MREIKGFEGRYSVTEDGQVYSHLRNHFLALQLFEGRYYRVGLRDSNRRFHFPYVHVLVATAFLEKPEGENLEVTHIDGIKTNNYYTNLEWVIRPYELGLEDKTKTKVRTLFVDFSKSNSYIPQISLEDKVEISELYGELKSLRKVARQMSMSHEAIRQALLAFEKEKND